MMFARLPFLIVAWFWLMPFAKAEEVRPAPEAASGYADKALVTAQRQMVVAAHPLAAEAGREILRAGGTAVDAAIATELVLGLVEPQSSGLGGGAFLVHFDAASGKVDTFDGRETAPAAARPDRFLRDGQPLQFDDAVRSGLSVGAPGLLRMLELAHQRYGKLPWASLFAPAIRAAEAGFAVTPRLHLLLEKAGPGYFSEAARQYFFDAAGQALPTGALLKNPEYAATLRRVAEKGAEVFYSGDIAEAIVKAVQAAPVAAGDLTLADIAGYRAKERPPVCVGYRSRQVCGIGPPSSGAIAVGSILKLIEPFAEVHGAAALMSPEALHLIAEAEKLTYADRNHYVADPDVIAVPSGMTDESYLAERRKFIDPKRAMEKAAPGLPPPLSKKTWGLDATIEVPGTTQVSIVDSFGNAVSMTATIENAFGSRLWAAGFLLNNELTDFSFAPTDAAGVSVANAVGPGKRPRSSMAPTIVLGADGKPEIVTGSPGGSKIILFVAKTLIGMIDWGLDAQQAAALPNFGSTGGAFEIENGASSAVSAFQLTSFGHAVISTEMTSGVATIWRRNGVLQGGADPRREGVALGD